ncbi:MAG: hypothetical protein OEZ22_00320 [Spirochaetia bacterium]|nr:hypothetical protein [Spirochaetia bacterium]
MKISYCKKQIIILMVLLFSIFSVNIYAQEQQEEITEPEVVTEEEIPAEPAEEPVMEEQITSEEAQPAVEVEETAIESEIPTETTEVAPSETNEEVPVEQVSETTMESPEGETATASGMIYSDGKTTYATSGTKFSLDSHDQLSALKLVEYKVGDNSFQRYEAPIFIEQEGKHRILFRGIDNVGNQEPESVYLVVIDNTAPEISVVTDPVLVVDSSGRAFGPSNVNIDLKVIDNYSGVKKMEYSLDGGAYQEYAGPINLSEVGYHQLKYRAIDNLGNQSTEKSISLEIDANAPKVSIQSERRLIQLGEQQFTSRDNIFKINVMDEESGIQQILVKVDGEADFRPYTNPIRFELEGNHTIEAKAIDRVGNQTETRRLDFIVDDNPPKTSIKPVSE